MTYEPRIVSGPDRMGLIESFKEQNAVVFLFKLGHLCEYFEMRVEGIEFFGPVVEIVLRCAITENIFFITYDTTTKFGKFV